MDSRYRYEHIIVAEKKIGRFLEGRETVHHIDGDKKNNNPDNLMIFSTLAAHARYHRGGRLIDNGDGTYQTESSKLMLCLVCGKKFKRTNTVQKYCSHDCADLAARKVLRPSKEELDKLIFNSSFLSIGKMYGVSDNAIRKWCKKYNLPHRTKDIKKSKEGD